MNRFAKSQLWGNSFGEQRWGATLGSSAGEQLWVAALEATSDSFPDQLTASGSSNFWEKLSAAFGQQLWGAALGRGFEEQLCTAALKNFSFGEHLGERKFGEDSLGSNFGEQLS